MMERSIKAIATSFAAMVTCGVAITPYLASAQSTASPHTSAVRYDIAGRVVGTIAPDPDDAGPLGHPATRTTYDNRNMPVLVETGVLNQWQDESTLPENWGADFTLHSSAQAFYDSNRRKVKDIARDSSGNIVGLSQYSYDNRGRLECTAIRMNPAAYGSIDGINACDLGPAGAGANAFGPDRITKNIYNAAGEIVQVRTAVGTNVEIASVTYEFTDNGQIEHLIDANGNKAKLVYDDYDRQTHWYFPEKARSAFVDNGTVQDAINSAGSPSATDYEQYAYDANGNRTSLRKRDGWVIEYFYDDLNRMIEKRFPDRPDLGFRAEFDIFYSYDLRGLQTSARFQSPTGAGVLTAYDGFGAVKSEDNMLGGTVQSSYDKNGNRTQVIYPDGETFTHEYDGLNRHKKVLDPAGNALVTYAYNNRGLPENATRLQSAPDQSWIYDDAGRLAASTIATTSSQFDVTWDFTRNPASQILSESISNSSTYSWDGLVGVPEVQPDVQIHRTYTTNGLNQYTDVGGDAFTYDDNGNLTSDGVDTFIYDHENRLVEANHYDSVSQTTYRVILLYDPMGRLMRINSYDPTLERVDFLYDGDAMVVETGANGMIQRHVHGPAAGADDPLVSYPGSSVNYGNARFLSTDARGSIVYSADRNDGNRVVNTYDEYGNPGTSNGGRFQYTGQSWLPQLEMYYYKARIYSPKLGRFLQVDPIGYEDQFNLYAYVGNDPINGIDPTGLQEKDPHDTTPKEGELLDYVDGFVEGAWEAIGSVVNAGGNELVTVKPAQSARQAEGRRMSQSVIAAAPLPGAAAASTGRLATSGSSLLNTAPSLAAQLVRNPAVISKTPVRGAKAAVQRYAATVGNIRKMLSGNFRPITGNSKGLRTFDKAHDYARSYGGRAADYNKVSTSAKTASGDRVSVHAVYNSATHTFYSMRYLIGR